jgi:hypothetical protein
MSRSALHIFSKNTDANASIRGYNYQILKTIETWVSNALNQIDDEIYCEYEDDIFQKGRLNQAVKFRQIKLYSSNFSFQSKEIEKCIIHFFMLYLKPEYAESDMEFAFETNTNIANKHQNNEAELLRKWYESQGALTPELLQACVGKVKSIISAHIQKEESNGHAVEDAISLFNRLNENNWIDFVKQIKWSFLNTDPDMALASTMESINCLIEQLPHATRSNLAEICGQLHMEVLSKSSKGEPQDRKLTNDKLKRIILHAGSEKDKWYADVYDKWKKIGKVEHFRVGEFFEIIDAAKHCRYHTGDLQLQDELLWINLLGPYIFQLHIDKPFAKKAVYEYLWIKLRLNSKICELRTDADVCKAAAGDLSGCEDLIQNYFLDFQAFEDATQLDDAQNLLIMVYDAKRMGKVNLSAKDMIKWFKSLYITINQRITSTTKIGEKCCYLETLGYFQLFYSTIRENRRVEDVLRPFDELLSIINDAPPSYDATQVSQYIKILINLYSRKKKDMIKALEVIDEKLDKYIYESGKKYKYQKAGKKSERGVAYMNSSDPVLLDALSCFLEAKDLYYQAGANAEYVSTSMNIIRLYNAIGMNLASKYYALQAVKWCSYYSEEVFRQKYVQARAMIFQSDFSQGAWLSAIIDFCLYMRYREELVTSLTNNQTDDTFMRALPDYIFMLYASQKLSDQFGDLIELIINSWGENLREHIKNVISEFEGNSSAVGSIIQSKIIDFPLNDTGEVRIIQFYALGILWKVSFNNEYVTTSMAEEFCALLQIALTEIALFEADFHLIKSTIEIELEPSENLTEPEALAKTEYGWRVFIYHLDDPNKDQVIVQITKMHDALYAMLNEVSLLNSKEFDIVFCDLLKEKSYYRKEALIKPYQGIYREIVSDQLFTEIKRRHFSPVSCDLKFPRENKWLPWNGTLSPKYSKDEALCNIRNRFDNNYRSTHVTLERLKKDIEFHDLIKSLREQGYLDWQIISAMMNFICDYKARLEVSKMPYADEPHKRESYLKAKHKYYSMDEEDCRITFSLESFKSAEFQFQLEQIPLNVLDSFGLVYRLPHPNFAAIKEFLDIRFSMNKDNDVMDNNPLSYIT